MLRDMPVGPVIPVSDLERSLAFYEGMLGLSGEAVPGGYALHCGRQTTMYLVTDTTHHGSASWPLASFQTDRFDDILAELHDTGVEHVDCHDENTQADMCGLAKQVGSRMAWITDPDDQVIAIFEL
jgi:catechol 2,3-dioxygenase-like lactoylglutathione lyase family enzyme